MIERIMMIIGIFLGTILQLLRTRTEFGLHTAGPQYIPQFIESQNCIRMC